MSKAIIGFQLEVKCPHCSITFDLVNHDDNDEGFWTGKIKDWLNNKKGADKLKVDVECPVCENRVDVTEIEY